MKRYVKNSYVSHVLLYEGKGYSLRKKNLSTFSRKSFSLAENEEKNLGKKVKIYKFNSFVKKSLQKTSQFYYFDSFIQILK